MKPRFLGAGMLVVAVCTASGAIAETTAPIEYLEHLSSAFRDAYERVAPAVVLVHARPERGALPAFHPPIPEQYRRRPADTPEGRDLLPEGLLPPDHPRAQPGERFDSEFIGSGTLVDEAGYILSNYHVVAASDSVSVTLSDQRSFPARIVGFDALIDIAVLKIEATNLPPPAELGDASTLRIGDWVLAIGHPLGMGSTLTHGIVSALGRKANILHDEYSIESFIQTNAVINKGNSGGPLLNLRGQVVGVNTAIATQTGWFIGYGFAVPIDLAKEAMADILEHGRVVRGYLGVSMESVKQSQAESPGTTGSVPMGERVPAGVFLTKIFPSTPAESAGLLRGDVLLRVEDVRVDHPNQVQTAIYALDPGETVRLSILRDGLTREVPVILGEREEDELLEQGRQLLVGLGLEVEALTARRGARLGFTREISSEIGFEQGQSAVVVTAVRPGSAAADKGVRVDDVITEIDEELVISHDQFLRQLAQLEPGKSSFFWLWRRQGGVDVRAFEIGQ
jgi:serine protease Do